MPVSSPRGVGSEKNAASPKRSFRERVRSMGETVVHHLKRHTGVGIVCAVAYFDPGNWGVDLQAGSQYGYSLLFIVLLSGVFAVFLQVLASRLGCVTGLDLASHCRLLLHSRPKHTRLYRFLGLYPLYALSEIAIIATDLAELIGSAIALCLLFPKLKLWHGVLITTFDVFLLLLFGDPLRGRPVRMFELLIAGLVIAVLICMGVIISRVEIVWSEAFKGYLPSKSVFSSGALYTAVGILGATVMPHSLYLGSALATQDRISPAPRPANSLLGSQDSFNSDVSVPAKAKTWLFRTATGIRDAFCTSFRVPLASSFSTQATRHADRENRPYAIVIAHIHHGVVDMVINLMGFAVIINSFILILASAVFFYGDNQRGTEVPASLFDAYDLISSLVGKAAAILFAIALLASGQSSSIIATVAGQAVSEGFLHWRTSPAMRRIITRLIAIIPSMVVAVAVGQTGIDTLLVASQVVLSIVLPFVIIPLVYLTSSKSIMTVRKARTILPPSSPSHSSSRLATPQQVEGADADELVDFSNGWIVTGIGATICLIVVAANIYVLVTLGQGS